MKNLKRVLSLGLASVMLLGMMVVGASAAGKDFTDAEDIVHTEAVETMVALKVINGKEDGSYFDPKGTVTRGEMAKMIAVVMNGGSEANTGVKGTPSFTDIGGHWAEGWIEYCADMKIINGRGDGTFDPNGNVTGTEALKMVLTAMGYDAEAYHLQGAAWASQTLERARQTGGMKLTEELADVVMTEPATRDVAAQMIWNGLQAFVVTNSPEQNTNNGEVTWGWHETKTTLLEQRYNAYVMRATFDGNEHYGATSALKGEIGVTPNATEDQREIGSAGKIFSSTQYVFPGDMTIDNIGEEVKVVWKNGPKSSSAGPDKNDTIYGVFNTGATRVINTQLSKIQENKSSDKVLKIDGTKYDTKAGVTVVTNFDSNNEKVYLASNGNSSINSDLTNRLKHNSGDTIKVVFDEADNKISKIYLTETYVASVTSVNSSAVVLNNVSANLKFEDHDIEDGLQKGDVVLVTPYYDTINGGDEVVTVKKAEKVSGEVTGYKDDENVTVGGKVYKLNYKNQTEKDTATEKFVGGSVTVGTAPNTVTYTSSVTSSDGYAVKNAKFGLLPQIPDEPDVITSFNTADNKYINADVDLYLSNGYVVAAVETSNTNNNYSLITEVKNDSEAGGTFGALQLQVMAADGTKEIITVSKDSKTQEKLADGSYRTLTHDTGKTGSTKKTSVSEADYWVGDIITYTFNDDDEAEVKMEGMVGYTGALSYNDKSKTINSQVTTGDCVLFVKTEGTTMDKDTAEHKYKVGDAEWDAYNLRDLDDDDVNTNAAGKAWTLAWNHDGTKVIAAFADLCTEPGGTSENTIWGIVTNEGGWVKDYYLSTVQANGEEYEIQSKDKLVKGELVTYKRTANDKYGTGKITVVSKAAYQGNSVPVGYTGDLYVEGYVREYSARDNSLNFYTKVTGSSSTGYTGDTTTDAIYALDKDCRIVYVDQDNTKSLGEASIDTFDGSKGNVNVVMILKKDNGDWVIKAMFVETSGKDHANRKHKAISAPGSVQTF